ncbi:AbrB family transcriptional regulator [Clostridium sp. MSJ-11]|uniref:AbrB family transcriptional regulator n=1 Tax=Clostridium mobile TaxID=2841512 RepID=A0ABS6EES2_9CLOT|nr:AbrB family transcriptional regulator [Clostridium mobile]MBU5482889.1 AbrB family transcriptional regulator [Clostridium mobile]
MEKIIYTLVIALLGGYIGIKAKIPAGALVGAMISVAIYNIYTGKGDIPYNFKLLSQIVVGGMIGLNFTMDSVKQLKSLIFPAIILVVGLTLFSLILGFIIHKITGLDLITSLFSSAPGGITDMTLISEAYGADISKVALLHLMRLVTVITVMPIAIKIFSKIMLKK